MDFVLHFRFNMEAIVKNKYDSSWLITGEKKRIDQNKLKLQYETSKIPLKHLLVVSPSVNFTMVKKRVWLFYDERSC